jgi:prepilin-type N-terminal cleavage/methylation domain-containing protein
MPKNEQGFSLIETMVTVSIIVLLAVITLGAVRSNQDQESLNSSIQKTVAELRLQKARSSGVSRVATPNLPSNLPPVYGFGLRATDPSTYILYQDIDHSFSYSLPSEIISTQTLPPGITFNFQKMPGVKDLCFTPPTGTLSSNQNFTLYFKAKNIEKTIKIDVSGNLNYD